MSPEQFPGVDVAVKSERERILGLLDGLMLLSTQTYAPVAEDYARVDGWNDALNSLRKQIGV